MADAAMGCQRDIARKVVDKKADYVPGLKGKQGSLREDVALFVAEQKVTGFKHAMISGRSWPYRNQDHDGHDVAWLQKRHDWPGLKAVVMVESTREIAASATVLGSLAPSSVVRSPARLVMWFVRSV